jgi:hypothetical protein
MYRTYKPAIAHANRGPAKVKRDSGYYWDHDSYVYAWNSNLETINIVMSPGAKESNIKVAKGTSAYDAIRAQIYSLAGKAQKITPGKLRDLRDKWQGSSSPASSASSYDPAALIEEEEKFYQKPWFWPVAISSAVLFVGLVGIVVTGD